jgi:hypothetical protein
VALTDDRDDRVRVRVLVVGSGPRTVVLLLGLVRTVPEPDSTRPGMRRDEDPAVGLVRVLLG